MKRRYYFEFMGREKGALGIQQHLARAVQAETLPAAHLALYDTHEHISVLTVNSRTMAEEMASDAEGAQFARSE